MTPVGGNDPRFSSLELPLNDTSVVRVVTRRAVGIEYKNGALSELPATGGCPVETTTDQLNQFTSWEIAVCPCKLEESREHRSGTRAICHQLEDGAIARRAAEAGRPVEVPVVGVEKLIANKRFHVGRGLRDELLGKFRPCSNSFLEKAGVVQASGFVRGIARPGIESGNGAQAAVSS